MRLQLNKTQSHRRRWVYTCHCRCVRGWAAWPSRTAIEGVVSSNLVGIGACFPPCPNHLRTGNINGSTTPTPVLCNKCRRNPAPDHCTKIARGERLTKRTSRRTAAQRFIKPWTIYARASRPGCRAAVLLACACTHADADACGMLCVNAAATPPRITFPANWRFITTRAGQARRSKVSILHLGIRAGVLRALPTLEQVILMACIYVHADADACALLCANATAVPRITQKDRAEINYLLSKIY